jgi:hypothetical protein
MATISHEPVSLPALADLDGVRLRRWPDMANGDVGEKIILTRFNDRTVSIDGTFSGATVNIQGSNDDVNWYSMYDVFGNAIAATTGKLITLTEVPLYIRPSVSAGAGASITVVVCGVGRG